MKRTPIPFSYVTRNGKVHDLNGNVCVLTSRGYNGGWSTAPYNPSSCMFSPVIVEWVMRGSLEEETPNFKAMFGEDFCTDAAHGLAIELIKEGTCFCIRYDADMEAEFIEHHDRMDWQVA